MPLLSEEVIDNVAPRGIPTRHYVIPPVPFSRELHLEVEVARIHTFLRNAAQIGVIDAYDVGSAVRHQLNDHDALMGLWNVRHFDAYELPHTIQERVNPGARGWPGIVARPAHRNRAPQTCVERPRAAGIWRFRCSERS